MLNVLLADDETRTLHHLMTGVPWFQLGMEVCCTASNGSEALAFIESHPIDILITDIRMPGMDGLELCQRVRERYLSLIHIWHRYNAARPFCVSITPSRAGLRQSYTAKGASRVV